MDNRPLSYGCIFEISIHGLAPWGISTRRTSLIQQSPDQGSNRRFSWDATALPVPDKGRPKSWLDEAVDESKMGREISCFEVDQIFSLTIHGQQPLDIATK